MYSHHTELKNKMLEMRRKVKEDFHRDRELGEQAERLLMDKLSEGTNTCFVRKMDHTLYPYDIRFQSIQKGHLITACIEVKRLAGCSPKGFVYDTGFVEVWLDDNKTRRPQWHNKQVTHLFMWNNHKQLWYVYEAQPVIKFLQNWEGETKPPNNDTACKQGSGILFYWEPQKKSRFASLPGYVGTYTNEEIKEIKL